MSQERLLDVIERACAEVKVTPRAASISADIGEDFVRDMRRRDHDPKTGRLKKLAFFLGVPVSLFVDAVDADYSKITPVDRNADIDFKSLADSIPLPQQHDETLKARKELMAIAEVWYRLKPIERHAVVTVVEAFLDGLSAARLKIAP